MTDRTHAAAHSLALRRLGPHARLFGLAWWAGARDFGLVFFDALDHRDLGELYA